MTDTVTATRERPTDETQARIPEHVAIIMDGNGRWARARGLKHRDGHRQGVESVRFAIRFANRRGIKHLTLYSFSSENWSRPAQEIDDLFNLLRYFVGKDLDGLINKNVRIHFIGERVGLPEDVQRLITRVERSTAHCTGLNLLIALNYGGRNEMTRAAQRIARRVAAGELAARDIDEACLAAEMYTAGFPDPDVIIRTSGELRISNFLLWQAATADLVFLQDLWPDFAYAQFDAALRDYSARTREIDY